MSDVNVVGMPEFNELLDHIHEYGTVAEGVVERANAFAQAVIARYTPPEGYVLISEEVLRVWGKLDEVRECCRYPKHTTPRSATPTTDYQEPAMTTETDLLPLPKWMSNYTIPADDFECDKGVMLVDRMHDYARANVARAIATKDAEIDTLRTRLEDTVRDSTNKIEALRTEAEQHLRQAMSNGAKARAAQAEADNLRTEVERLRAEVERLRTDGASAVRWAPGSAYWSEVLEELFGPDARKGIDVLEARWRKELERADTAVALLRQTTRSAITFCDNCGCSWLDDGLNPIGCPYCKQAAAVAAIQFALNDPEGRAFLRLWNEGDFDTLRREWPDAPSTVYVGADPLATKRQEPKP